MRRRPILGATLWDLIEAFFEAQRQYHYVFHTYEARVMMHAEMQAVDRHQLRLEADEVSRLLDFDRLGELRSGPLYRTKEIAHALFRSKGRTHKFDRYISEIFHDLSILREEQYKVSTFAFEYKRANEMAEYESLLDEVHEDFPRRVHNIWSLFVKAQLALENVLRAHSRDPLYLRSLYLFGDKTLRDAYPAGKVAHCWRVFDRGPAEANLLAARSFAQSGFKKQALEALEAAIAAANAGPPPGSDATVEGLNELAAEGERLKALIQERSLAELIQMTWVEEPAAPQFGDDAAPDLDLGPHDEPDFALQY